MNKPIDRSWSRKKIVDEFSGLKKKDGQPAARQAVHMARKRAEGICLTCTEPAAVYHTKKGVKKKSPYCVEHMVAARERMRKKMKYNSRLTTPSYEIQEEGRS